MPRTSLSSFSKGCFVSRLNTDLRKVDRLILLNSIDLNTVNLSDLAHQLSKVLVGQIYKISAKVIAIDDSKVVSEARHL